MSAYELEDKDEQDARYAARGMPRIYPRRKYPYPRAGYFEHHTLEQWPTFIGEPYQGVAALWDADLQRANGFDDRADLTIVRDISPHDGRTIYRLEYVETGAPRRRWS